MFNFFKKKKQIDTLIENGWIAISEEEYSFLKSLTLALPKRYSFLISQIDPSFILWKKHNQFGENGSYTFVIDQDKEKKVRKPKPYYHIKGVTCLNIEKQKYEPIELDILDEVLVG